MALPHLPTSYTTRKNIYEAAIVNRRVRENDMRQKWSGHARDFHRFDVEMAKQRAWESEASFHASMDAYKAEQEKENKQQDLQRRRDKLSEMLIEERSLYEAELRGLSGENYARLEEMRERSEGLRSAREEKRKKLAEEKLYDNWRLNNPDIRKLEEEQHKQHVIGTWREQKEEQRVQQEEAQQKKIEFEKKLEEERLLALEAERIKEEEKREEEKRLQLMLRDQMAELKDREREAKSLRSQEELLMKEQWNLEQMEGQRKQMEKERQKLEFGRILLRQHAAALKRKSRQIQQELEEDKKFLEQLAEQEAADQAIKSARRDKAQADATWMKQVIEDQIRLEKAREAELDMLYQDEAARVWHKREEEWARERLARERLMKEVLDTRQEQVQQKMETVRKQQEESLERREQLLQELEFAHQLTQRDVEDREAAKTERKRELEAQMSSRKEKELDLRLQLEEEMKEEKRAEEDYEEMLRQEAERMKIRGYQPKPTGRRQAWN